MSNLHNQQGQSGLKGLHEIQELQQILREPARILADGGLVAFPTETVYGLGANAFNERAVRGVFSAKGRPADNPLIVHIANINDISKVTDETFVPSPAMRKAMETFWPGPLTIIMPVNQRIAKSVHPGMDTVGVRMPAHPVARTLIELSECPIAAPSANQSGRPSPTTARDVAEDMDGRIDGVVDGGSCLVGLESTVVSITDTEAVIYRPGGITREQLEEALGIPVSLDPHLTSSTPSQFAPKSPGMKYRHYAPNATVDVWWGNLDCVRESMLSFYRNLPEAEQSATAIMAPDEIVQNWPFNFGSEIKVGARVEAGQRLWTGGKDPWATALSHALYHQLREFDRQGMKRILICGVNPTDGIGSALMNRLQKSSEGRIHAV